MWEEFRVGGILWEESHVGGILWEESCMRNPVREESRVGGIPFGRNPMWEESWWEESHGRNPVGGILHGRNPDGTTMRTMTESRRSCTYSLTPFKDVSALY